ncbi:MAG: hypothetical protein U0R50_17015 [Gaiellales bacterium]
MDIELTDEIEPRKEPDAVASWRFEVLLDAGYDQPLAEQLAASDADLHLAVALVGEGCPPRLAAEILL